MFAGLTRITALIRRTNVAIQPGAKLMSNSKKPGKEEKKHSLLTPKEKKAAKQLKKHGGDAVPILQRNP
jgi:hypothetical protein